MRLTGLVLSNTKCRDNKVTAVGLSVDNFSLGIGQGTKVTKLATITGS